MVITEGWFLELRVQLLTLWSCGQFLYSARDKLFYFFLPRSLEAHSSIINFYLINKAFPREMLDVESSWQTCNKTYIWCQFFSETIFYSFSCPSTWIEKRNKPERRFCVEHRMATQAAPLHLHIYISTRKFKEQAGEAWFAIRGACRWKQRRLENCVLFLITKQIIVSHTNLSSHFGVRMLCVTQEQQTSVDNFETKLRTNLYCMKHVQVVRVV